MAPISSDGDSPARRVRRKVEVVEEPTNVELATLRLLASLPEGPVGSSALAGHLAEGGLVVSEPTIGRALNRLDRNGLTVRVSNRGRILTRRGHHRVRRLLSEEARNRARTRLLEVLNPQTAKGLRDVLVVRRALECEAARLAAANATRQDLKLLERAMDPSTNPRPGAFHQALTHASHNDALIAMLDIISNEQLHRRLRAIIDEVGQGSSERAFSLRIVDAIASRNAEAAASVMSRHFASMLSAVARARDS